MLSDERLNDIGIYLQKISSSNPGEIRALNNILSKLYNLDEYQEWLKDGQFHSDMSPNNMFFVPKLFGKGEEFKDMHLLDKYMLYSAGQLLVKIDKHRGRIHLTDGNWVPAGRRVFPYVDESEALIKFAEENKILDGVDVLIDPACGCGHHALGTPKGIIKISSDISLRAIAYCRINALLSDHDDILLFDRDLRRGISPTLRDVVSKKCLIMINMPFALYPQKERGATSTNGGERGIELTSIALKAIADFIKSARAEKIEALILCYTVGNKNKNTWEIEDICNKLLTEKWSFQILKDEKLWRVNGRKEQENPMPIQNILRLKGRCKHTFAEKEMDEQERAYIRLEDDLGQLGFSHLAYGVVRIQVNRPI